MHAAVPRWSPDGKRIAFRGQRPEEPWRIFIVSADGGSPEQLTTGEDSTGFDPTWAPDGKSLALSGYPGSKIVIHVLNLMTKELSLLPHSDGLWSPNWSPDGRYISALSVDSAKLLLFNLQSRTWTELAEATFGYPTG
jgi:Tol biopolymer transport system component